MKYKPVEPSSELLRELCCNIGEDMKYILSEICNHNRRYPQHKITIEYIKGSSVATISDKNNKGDLTFFQRLQKRGFLSTYHLFDSLIWLRIERRKSLQNYTKRIVRGRG